MDSINVGVFKYPLGFIRIIEMVFLIIALCAVNSWNAEVQLSCDANATTILHLRTNTFSMSNHFLHDCDGKEAAFWTGSWGGAAGFFYFTAVVTMIFVFIVTFSYMALWQVYEQDKRIPLADLAVTALLFVFWFFNTSIWWAAANGIGEQTSVESVRAIVNKDARWGNLDWVHAANGRLTISVLSGWVLVGSLAMNCWFVWKEVVPRSPSNPTSIA